MLKKFKMLIELVSKKETEEGAIGLKQGGLLMRDLSKIAEKYNMTCYSKGEPAEKLNYVPTGKQYEIKTVEDIATLTAEQFEFFIDDLRNFCNVRREVKQFNDMIGFDIVKASGNGFTWLDTGLNEAKVTFETTNKL